MTGWTTPHTVKLSMTVMFRNVITRKVTQNGISHCIYFITNELYDTRFVNNVFKETYRFLKHIFLKICSIHAIQKLFHFPLHLI